ncbi:MAG: HisA/HisF-related TIM barrel protein [Acidimicrobiales bacterium]|jgi:phosphoribosylformimino-5-aminoimidazole carboxamide ribotide isomerase
MELYPAIDLRDGGAVRLTQGDFDRQVGYGDPLTLAARFIESGASWIHVVDLDAARTGVPHERATLGRIVALAGAGAGAGTAVKVQTGGGIRTEDDVADVLALGVARVVLGTAALEDPALATRCARRWPGQIAVGLDYVLRPDGVPEARGHGWQEGSGRTVHELLDIWAGEPIGAVVATAIARDGMLGGSDVEGMRSLLASTTLPVIASGGVGSLDHLRALADLSVPGDTAGGAAGGAAGDAAGEARTLAGVIVGKALVEGRFELEEAVAACRASV